MRLDPCSSRNIRILRCATPFLADAEGSGRTEKVPQLPLFLLSDAPFRDLCTPWASSRFKVIELAQDERSEPMITYDEWRAKYVARDKHGLYVNYNAQGHSQPKDAVTVSEASG